ncbi:SusC/RagA family TonB-linked outer membrane protein [Sabulilitoribacter multivorans]|uniref:SusC/RagA family TonB-linked outer membrane protein n=1 Tax=Flaviramulus multivorans TaxID=1304750 RepID=A0ABS9IKQ8_9FLAO|nr:SusC/RagA family TonB-linked outer membrane protein [Flaviramulus multivorans]MCF7561155.1 SusC/RagA family TonB-linked outer membrane protein [Flaviramulus multivorans]
MKTKFSGMLTLFLAFVVQLTFAQEKTISGVVSDNAGLPLPGASVVVKGTTSGTSSDFDGKYSIKASQGSTLVFSFVGYTTKEIVVGTSNTIDATLQESAEALEEVVITAQGIQAKPRSLSYAVETVGGDNIEKARETNIVSSLSAKAAGVQVTTSSGSVGASANIRVRGNTSITRSNSPLFVVDGVPIDNSSFSEDPTQSFNNSSTGGSDFSNRAVDINSNDIESISILKGIAAQTLYGLRAANGVVLITTKKGKSGKTRATYSSEIAFSEYNKVPKLQRVYAQGRHFGGALQYRGPETFEGDSWGPKISDLEYNGDSTYPFNPQGALVPAGTGNGVAAQSYDPLTFFKTGEVYDNNLSVSGGNDVINYRASIGKLLQKGIAPNEEFERKTFRIDLQADLTDKLTLDASGQYTNSGGNRVQRGSNISGIMLGLLRTAPSFDNGNGLEGQAAANSESSYFYDIPGSELPGHRSYRDGIYNNPYFTVARNKNLDDVNRIIGKMGLTYKFSDAVSLKTSASVDRYSDIRKIGFDVIDASFGNGRVINDVISNQDVNWNMILSINKNLNENFDLTANIGYDGYYTKTNRQTVLGDGMTIPGFFNLSNVSTTQAQELSNAKKLIGAFATATLSYDNMLFITPSFRNDWSSTLPVNANTFQSYSVGASFVFSELMDSGFINYGKVRGSWGVSGNDAPVFATITNFGGTTVSGDGFIQSSIFPAYDSTSFERSSRAGNPNLTPEETSEFEVGFELSMLDSRLKFDFTYYDKETKDQIIFVDAAPSSGFVDRFENVGVVTNEGFEISLSGTPIRTEDFSWNIGVNWTTYENVVQELVEGVESITLNGFSSTSSRAIVGESYGAIFGQRYARNAAGDILIDDDGYPLADSTDGVIGDPIPDWFAGISNSFSYKNFSLSILIDIRQGGDVWNGTKGILDYFGVSEETLLRDQSTVFQGVVQSTGAVNTQSVPYSNPAISENNNYWRRYGFGDVAEGNVFDASWVRLREVTLSYDFPEKWLSNMFIDGVSVSAYGRNLWLNTDYPGVDPETNLTGDTNGIGLDYFNQPNTKSYGLNIKLNF